MSQMTYLLLQKKLHELESEFTHDLSNHLPELKSRLNPFVDDFHNRLVFLRNLLTAEIALHPVKPDLLAQIDGRLSELEAAFGRNYYTHYSSSSSDDTSSNDDHRTSSLNDGTAGEDDQAGVGVYDVVPEEVVVVPPAPDQPKKTFGYENTMRWDDDDDYRKVTGGGGSAWRREDFRVVAFWMMLGAILIVNFPSFFHSVV